MLYNLQPDRSVTGGAWYSDQDFESEFVEVLNQQCFKFLQSKVQEHASAEQRDKLLQGEHGGQGGASASSSSSFTDQYCDT